MIHTISAVAESNFIKTADLMAFVKGPDCPPDVIIHEVGNSDPVEPITNTWYVDALLTAFYKHGGKRMTHDEIIESIGGKVIGTARAKF